MAIVKNFWLINQSKKLAGAVIYQAMGQTRSRELASSVTNPRTTAQMTQRVKWSNLVNLYRANASWMKYAFETKKENQSEYNKFMSLNVTGSNIYLTKAIAAAGGCVVAPYTITQGSLPSIETTPSGPNWYTNIYLGADVDAFSQLYVGQFSQLIIDNNPAIRQGDQISLIRMTQQANSDTGVPYVVVRKYEVIIDTTSSEELSLYLPMDIVGAILVGSSYRLGILNNGNAGGFVFILSRTQSGKTYVSTQNIVVANNETMINAYSSDAALQAAIKSYGEEADAFLSSTSADANNQSSTSLSVLSLAINDNIVAVGTSAYPNNIQSSSDLTLNMNSNISGEVTSVIINVYKAGDNKSIPLHIGDTSGSSIACEVESGANTFPTYALQSVEVTIDGEVYTGVFSIPNAATIGGLE